MKPGHGGRATVQFGPSRRFRRLALAPGCLLLLAAILSPETVSGQAAASITADDSEGYGRMVITFEKTVPRYKVSTSTGVLVVQFDAATAPDVTRLNEKIGRYVNAARRDPNGRAVRLALARPVNVNTMEAGEKLFIDLLPLGWVGLPPGLPQEVVAELARRAEEVEKRRREQEVLDQFRNSRPVGLRLTSLPTFTRFVFVWDRIPEARIERAVDSVRIVFDRPAKTDFEGMKSRFPPYVRDIGSRLGESGLEVYLTVDPESPVRGFVEDTTYVVDVTAPEKADAGSAVLAPSGEEAAEPDPSRTPEQVRAALLDTEAESQVEDSHSFWFSHQVETNPDSELAEAPDEAESAIPVRPEARHFGSTVRLTLPFIEPTAAAVFEHAGALWSVFRSPQPVDARLLRRDLSGIARSIDTWRSNDVTVMRMALVRPLLTTVTGEATSWIITLGDSMLDQGVPLRLARQLGANGDPEVVVDFPTAAGVHEIHDESGSERLFVVTAMAPARPVPKPYSMVDFTLQKAIHGLAISPIADDVVVGYEDGRVRIGRTRGLNISQSNGAYAPGAGGQQEASRPGYVDYFEDTALDPGAVYGLLARHVRETALAEETDRTGARVQMARALLGTDLGAEALAQLELIEHEDPAALREPSIRALRGIAMTMMARPEEALREFDTFGLGESSDVALWRGIAEVQRGNWRAALAALKAGEPALSSYSPVRQRQFRIAAARAAIESGDISDAAVRLAELGEALSGSEPDLELTLLNGRLLAALGQTGEATDSFDTVIESGDRRLAAEAQLRRAETTRGGSGEDETKETIEALERLAIAWRGDEIELGALRLLANLHVEQGNHSRGFELMKSATVANSESPVTRGLQDDMSLAFEKLFLGGKADEMSAVDALALYYDFRELTPIGHKGDLIIRKLADRMVEIDLLQQASDLLRHQVDHRLKGAERAEVAAKLAWIYLMYRKPADAIVVLSRTRQAVLPREIAYQRLLLEARALSETGRTDLALDLLSAANGPEIEEIRAAVYWKGQRWQPAAEAFERSLDAVWGSAGTLTQTRRTRVLQGAIAYALANDQLGLQRFRSKFLPGMSESPDARAFDVVTLPVAGKADEFNKLVKRIAATDTLEGFLEEYKSRYVLPAKDDDRIAPQS